ncbi:MAG TPA: nucleoside-binding protein, partial [Pseudoalteromonas sp.]|nr:nucleoside-binding protein [Pseudoalteromonas sp.]
MKFKKLLPFITLTSLALSSSAFAANWSSTALHINNGSQKNPFTEQESDTTVYSVQHASGYDYGDNFFFIDYSKDDIDDGYQDADFYGEW